MKNKIFNLTTKKDYDLISLNKSDLKKTIEQNSFELFRIRIIVNDYNYEENNVDTIEALGIDENYQLVIFEYKIGKLTRTISNGFMQLDYIKQHSSQIKMLFNERIGIENARRVDYNPRLIVFGEHFHRFDYNSIKSIPYSVELDEVHFFNGNLFINHTYVNRQSDLSGLKINLAGMEKELFIEIRNNIFALGEEIVEYGNGNVISYRRVFNFAFVYISNGVHLCIQGRDYLIQDFDDINQYKTILEEEYDKN